MTTIHQEITVNYSAAEMFALVKNVNDYFRFLPHCQDSRILGQNKDSFRTKLILSKGLVKKAFTVDFYLRNDQLIQMRLLDKAFKQLDGYWRFEPLASGSKLTLHLEYEFANIITAMAYGNLFVQIANTLAQTFAKRAEEVYGKRS